MAPPSVADVLLVTVVLVRLSATPGTGVVPSRNVPKTSIAPPKAPEVLLSMILLVMVATPPATVGQFGGNFWSRQSRLPSTARTPALSVEWFWRKVVLLATRNPPSTTMAPPILLWLVALTANPLLMVMLLRKRVAPMWITNRRLALPPLSVTSFRPL